MSSFGDPSKVGAANKKWDDITHAMRDDFFERNGKCGTFISGLAPNGIDLNALTQAIKTSVIVWVRIPGQVVH